MLIQMAIFTLPMVFATSSSRSTLARGLSRSCSLHPIQQEICSTSMISTAPKMASGSRRPQAMCQFHTQPSQLALLHLLTISPTSFQFYSFSTQRFTTYSVPTPLALPLGCYVDSAGLVYIAELVANKILVFNPKTKALNEYPLPLPLQFPAVIRAERAGWVYFSLFVGNGIGRINQKTHEIQLFHTNQTGGLGSEDTIDKYGGVWLSFFTVDAMARLDTKTLQFSYVPFPDTFAEVGGNGVTGDVPPYVDIAVNYGPGDAIWFTSILYNSVGRYSLTGLYH